LFSGVDTGRVPHRQPPTRNNHRAGVAVPRRRHQHLLPRADAGPAAGRRTKVMP
jgi:hypothetical protein